MSKRELIDCICEINRGAKPEFLARFSEEDLNTYLEHLMDLDLDEHVTALIALPAQAKAFYPLVSRGVRGPPFGRSSGS